MQYATAIFFPTSVSSIDLPPFWMNPTDAIAEDGISATYTSIGAGYSPMNFTVGGGIPPNGVITGIRVGAKFAYAGSEDVFVASNIYQLSKNSTSYQAVTGSGNTTVGSSLAWIYNGGPGDLWGTSWSPSDFNDALVSGSVIAEAGGPSNTGTLSLDSIEITVYYTLNGETDMDFYRAAQEAGWKILFGEALPSLSSAAAVFPSTQSGATNRASVEGTRMIVLTVRGAGITLRGDGGTPTAGANGIDYPVGGPYQFSVNDSEGANFNAIQNGGTSTGWIEYWGLP